MRQPPVLSPADASAVAALATRAAEVDGVAPLNEDALLALDNPGGERHALLEEDGALVGYATLDRHGHGQLVVDPDRRRRGHGRALADALEEPEAWWSFGDLPAARAMATGRGLVETRQLLIMERDLARHPAVPPAARADVTVRGLVAADVPALLAVNAAAFADHPEQGALDEEGFALRAAEPWFRAEDVLLAQGEDGRLLGFHWTKRHGDGLGEVYVLGVHPSAAGRGLGRLMLQAGLAHLAGVGCDRVQLYVDGDDERPVGLYRSANFDLRRRDVAWGQPTGGRA